MSAVTGTLLVIAKEPVPGRVKTRLTSRLSPVEAAAVARAALADTLDAVAATPARRRVLVLDGDPGPWVPDEFEIVPQVDGGLDLRLAAAFAAATGPTLLVGMDTPQVTPALLRHGLDLLDHADTCLGLAEDGGWWALGMRGPDPAAFPGVPMSRDDTGEQQRRRLADLGLTIADLPTLRDVDHPEDLPIVAAASPAGRFTRLVAELTTGRVPA